MKYRAFIIVVVLLHGCRHVVVDRDAVSALNDKQWTVLREPASTAQPPRSGEARDTTP